MPLLPTGNDSGAPQVRHGTSPPTMSSFVPHDSQITAFDVTDRVREKLNPDRPELEPPVLSATAREGAAGGTAAGRTVPPPRARWPHQPG